GVDASRSSLRIDLQRARRPGRGTERELVEPDGGDLIANLLAGRPHSDPGRPGGPELGGGTEPECGVPVGIVAAADQGRYGGGGRPPRRPAVAPDPRVGGGGGGPSPGRRDCGPCLAGPRHTPR